VHKIILPKSERHWPSTNVNNNNNNSNNSVDVTTRAENMERQKICVNKTLSAALMSYP
jgi:hypothetical protein